MDKINNMKPTLILTPKNKAILNLKKRPTPKRNKVNKKNLAISRQLKLT